MRIDTFRMERMQCTYENEVDYNLSESGVLPLKLEELLSPEQLKEFASWSLKYAPANGSPELRENIAQWYPGATADHVTVQVQLDATCSPGAPTVGVVPTSQSGTAGTTLVYTVSLTNGDSASCAQSTFALSRVVPSG